MKGKNFRKKIGGSNQRYSRRKISQSWRKLLGKNGTTKIIEKVLYLDTF